MRLYVNENEIDVLKLALDEAIKHHTTPIIVDRLSDLRERVELCDQLQHNERKAGRKV